MSKSEGVSGRKRTVVRPHDRATENLTALSLVAAPLGRDYLERQTLSGFPVRSMTASIAPGHCAAGSCGPVQIKAGANGGVDVTRIVMILSNPFRPDPRVDQEARTLSGHGHEVTVVCWDRRGELTSQEKRDGIRVIRIQNVPAGYGTGWPLAVQIPRFWRQAVRLAIEMQPDVVHCHDLDTLYAGWRIKQRLGCFLIYDAHEHYPAMVSLSLPMAFVRALVLWERRLMRRVDATITASTVLRDEFASRGVSPAIALGNYHELAPYRAVTEAEVRDLRARLGVAPDDVMVAYVGVFSPNRMLLPMIEAAGSLPHVKFHIWGDGVQRVAIERAAAACPNVRYHGWLAPSELPCHFKAADVIFYCLKLDYPGAVYNAPNALSCAMAAGRPVVATDVGDLGRMVRAADCGVLLGEATPRAIVGAIQQLLDPATRARLGSNALRAAEGPYNATAQRAQLLEVYRGLGLHANSRTDV
jgi:glycosyltransferase involved in cell wall biosynthesis